jgi:hypothetical protein
MCTLCTTQAQLRSALGLPEIEYPVPAPPSTAAALPPADTRSSSGGGGNGGVSGAVVGGIVVGVVVIVGLFAAVLGELSPQNSDISGRQAQRMHMCVFAAVFQASSLWCVL